MKKHMIATKKKKHFYVSLRFNKAHRENTWNTVWDTVMCFSCVSNFYCAGFLSILFLIVTMRVTGIRIGRLPITIIWWLIIGIMFQENDYCEQMFWFENPLLFTSHVYNVWVTKYIVIVLNQAISERNFFGIPVTLHRHCPTFRLSLSQSERNYWLSECKC